MEGVSAPPQPFLTSLCSLVLLTMLALISAGVEHSSLFWLLSFSTQVPIAQTLIVD